MSEDIQGTGFTQLQQSRILLQWLATIDGLSSYELLDLNKIPKYDEADIIEALQDGISIMEALAEMDTITFPRSAISYEESDPYQAYSNYQIIVTGLRAFYERLHAPEDGDARASVSSSNTQVFGCLNQLGQRLQTMRNDIEQTSIRSINQAAFVNLESLMLILELALGVAVNCDSTEQIIGSFTEKLNEVVLDDLMQITQDVLPKYCKKEDEEEESEPSAMRSSAMISDKPNNQDRGSGQYPQSTGFMDPSLRQEEKVVPDESALDLDDSYYPGGPKQGHNYDSQADFMNQSQRSANRSRREHNSSRLLNKSAIDVSIDHEYLSKIDHMEQENRDFRKEIEKLKLKVEAEKQKQVFIQQDNENLYQRISEFEMANKKNENLAGERQQQMQFEIELKEQQVQVLHEQMKERQIEFREKNNKLEEELDIEKENGVKLQKVTQQRDNYQKTIQSLQEGMEQYQELKIEMLAKNDRVKQMEKEVAVVDELHSVVKMLREDLAAERQKCTELELAVHDSQNTAEDLQRQLTMARKNVDKLKQNNFDLTNEIEKLRESQGSGSFISNSSFNQTMVQELEMKVQSLQSQNDTLRKGNAEAINTKYIELENRVFDAERKNKSLEQQVEQERAKNKKLVEDFEQMTTMVKEGETESQTIKQSSLQTLMLKNQKLEARLRELEGTRHENKELKASREKQHQDFKVMFDEKQKLFEDIMALKDHVAQARTETKEKIMSIGFIEKEKGLLQAQLEENKETIKKLNAEIQDRQNASRQSESKIVISEQLCQTLRKQIEEDKEQHQIAIAQAQAAAKAQAEANAQNEIKAAQAKVLEAQIQALEKEAQKQKAQKVQESVAKQTAADELAQQQKIQLQMSSDFLINQYQSDIIKYKLQCKDLEAQLYQKEKELTTSSARLKDTHEKELRTLKQDHEQQVRKLKNSISSLQNELNMECNSMSAQEEMLHSLIHNISVEFHKFNSTQSAQQLGKLKQKAEAALVKPSFLDSRAKQAYENM